MNKPRVGFIGLGLIGHGMASSPFAKTHLSSVLGNRPFGQDDLNGGPQLD